MFTFIGVIFDSLILTDEIKHYDHHGNAPVAIHICLINKVSDAFSLVLYKLSRICKHKDKYSKV